MHPVELEPTDFSLPFAGDSHDASIPGWARENVVELFRFAIDPEELFSVDVALFIIPQKLLVFVPGPLRVPCSRNVHLPVEPHVLVIPTLVLAHLERIHPKFPFAGKVDGVTG